MATKTTVSSVLIVLLASLCLPVLSPASPAQIAVPYTVNPCAPPAKWHYSFAVIPWVPGIKGTTTLGDRTRSVDISVSEAWDAISNLTGGFVGHFEAYQTRWGMFADVFWVEFGKTLDVTQVKPGMAIAELAATYSLKPGERYTEQKTVEAIAGARYTHLELTLSQADDSISRSTDWVDPFVGVRAQQKLTERLLWNTRVDYGGFGIGSSSKSTSKGEFGLGYILSNQWTADIGWRVLKYHRNKGVGDQTLDWNATLRGPYAGAVYRW